MSVTIPMNITIATKNTSLAKTVAVQWESALVRTRYDASAATLHIKVPEAEKMTRRQWVWAVRATVRTAAAHHIDHLRIDWTQITAPYADMLGDDAALLFAHAAQMAAYEFRTYKTKPKEGWGDVRRITLTAVPTGTVRSVRAGLRAGTAEADAVNFARDLANTPGADLTPGILAQKARAALRTVGVRVRVLDVRAMKRLRFGGVLSVGQGSSKPPKFIIAEYFGAADKKAAPVVLVGKGVTYDCGGIDTKPHPHGLEMMMDMSGAAAVIATLRLLAQRKTKRNIIALIPTVENMADGNSMRPGDILRMHDGTTVEVGHTDAEGRLILADALAYATRYKPSLVIDVATLTGAAMVALGERASAIFTTDDDLATQTAHLGTRLCDEVWRLPLWDEYDAEIKGAHADLSNIKTAPGASYGGAITAATFLKHFARAHKRWMHIDIAPTMTAVSDEHLAKGAKGSPVRLLTHLIQNLR